MLELNKAYCMDCMQGMAEFPDGFFDLAVVDPPYGIGIAKHKAVQIVGGVHDQDILSNLVTMKAPSRSARTHLNFITDSTTARRRTNPIFKNWRG